MLSKSNSVTLAAAAVLVALQPVFGKDGVGACSYHPFIQGALPSPQTYAKITTSCGTEYGHLNIGYVMSIDDGTGSGCNRCYAVKSQLTGKEVYILGVDIKGSPGLDIGESAWADLGHNERVNTNDPHHYANMQTCEWKQVAASNCAGICKSQVPGVDCSVGCHQPTSYGVYLNAVQVDKDAALATCAAAGSILPESSGMVTYKGLEVNQGYVDSLNRGSFI